MNQDSDSYCSDHWCNFSDRTVKAFLSTHFKFGGEKKNFKDFQFHICLFLPYLAAMTGPRAQTESLLSSRASSWSCFRPAAGVQCLCSTPSSK